MGVGNKKGGRAGTILVKGNAMKAGICPIVGVFVLVVAFGAALPSMAAAASDVNEVPPEITAEPRWPSLGGNYQRTGLSENAGPLAGDVKWKFEAGGAVVGSVTVGSDGRVHIACEDGKLYTLDSGGATLWTLDVNSPLLSAPSIGPDGSLYVGAKNGKLYAVDPSGVIRWPYATGDAIYSSPAVAPNGHIFVGSTDGMLYALNPDGTELWHFETKGPGVRLSGAVFASPALGTDGTIYIAGMYDPNLYALNPADGSVEWVCRFPSSSEDTDAAGWPFASPVVADDGTIYQALVYDSHLYAIEPTDGTIRWSVDLCDPNLFVDDTEIPTDSDGWSEPVLGPDGTIYVSLDDPYLRAVDPAGIVKWAKPFGDVGGFTMVVDNTGVVYAASDDGFVYLVAPDGSQLIPGVTGGWPAYPVVAADGLLIVADERDYSGLKEGGKNAVWAIDTRDVEYSQ